MRTLVVDHSAGDRLRPVGSVCGLPMGIDEGFEEFRRGYSSDRVRLQLTDHVVLIAALGRGQVMAAEEPGDVRRRVRMLPAESG